MHCVLCGVPLNDANQIGLICLNCRQTREEKKPSKSEQIQVRYCYRCGISYCPNDTSIQHCYKIKYNHDIIVTLHY